MLGEPSTKPYLSHGRWKGKIGALMQLVPARAPDVPSDLSPPAPRPTAADIAAKLRSGEMSLHASRVPLTRESLNSALVTAQKQLKLPTGINGGWTLEANAKLAYKPSVEAKDAGKTSPPSTSLSAKRHSPAHHLPALRLPLPLRNRSCGDSLPSMRMPLDVIRT